ncbi:MAG: hypothetical protein GX446_09155 [Chthonomonadales bacterium]|nr:hypothetical protein [Chthonomonadales bacterium]
MRTAGTRWAIAACLAMVCGGGVRAADVERLFDGRAAGAWDTARDSARLAAELAVSELTTVANPPSLRWRFVSRGPAYNDIFLRREIDRPFDAIRVRVRNAGAPMTLACKVGDANGSEWTANTVAMPESSDWVWVEFPWTAWKVASWSQDADGKLDFPLRYFTLIAFDVRPGVEYDLHVGAVEIVRPDRPVLKASISGLPPRVTAGRAYRVAIAFTVDRACHTDDAAIVFEQGGHERFRLPLRLPVAPTRLKPGQRIRLGLADVVIPRYARGGRHTARLMIGDARGDAGARRNVVVDARKPGVTVAEVKLHRGAPTLFINGKPHNGMAYAAYGPSVEVFTDFARAGVDLFTFSATPTEAGYGLSKTVWTAPGVYDYSEMDRRIAMVLQANPNAYFFPRLYLHAPRWWSERHPDDIVMMDPGDGKPIPFVHAGDKPAPSWVSEAWRKDTIEGLRRLIAHIESSPYADRCIGYHLASGTTEEWMMWGANEDQWVDYSAANVAAFRAWLRARYGSVEALRSAWNDSTVSFDSATVPTRAERARTYLGSLRDPDRERRVMDFYEYNSDHVADTICTFAGAVKSITGRRKTVGVFYGYLLQLCGEQRQQNAGHLALGKVLASPDIDFVCSPTGYAFRQVGGEGTSHFMSLFGSVRAHGKLWFNENDVRTSVSGGQPGEWGRPVDVAGDILQQDKELANALTNGAAQWWFDVGGNRYNDPRLMGRIGELTRAASRAVALDRTACDEVAMVVDERSLTCLRVGDPLGAMLLIGQIPALARIGAPVGHYLQSDLPRISDRKVFLFMTSFAPTEEERKAIDALKGGGRTLVFFYAPGLYRAGRLSGAAMEELTGIRIRRTAGPGPLRATLTGGSALTDGLVGMAVGADLNAEPAFVADDPDASVIARAADGSAAIVLKRHADWTSVYSAVPLWPARLLRNLCRSAGVHEYIATDDVVWATRGAVAVSAREGGQRLIHLPRAATVRDLFSGELVARDVLEFRADFAPLQTRAFALE